MKIQANAMYFFTKSGNQVRAIAPAEPFMGQPCWTVERTLGASAGKQMIVLARALVTQWVADGKGGSTDASHDLAPSLSSY
jgi:hypothetical protein